MSSVQAIDAEQKKIDELAETYHAKGYAVIRRPSPEQLPSFLDSLSPDLIAEGSDESVVVRVVTSDGLKENEQLTSLAERIEAKSGWRFDLHVIPRPDPTIEELLLSEKTIRSKSRAVTLLLGEGHERDAFLVCWTLTEALLRHLAFQNDVDLDDLHPGDIVKRLCMYGVIEESVMETLIDAVYVRNRLVHGWNPEEEVPMQSLMTITNALYHRVGEADGDALFDDRECDD
jgi:hypothetical protein